ncbi:MAG: YitT family protein [Clostridia bacterium]|nr:YitT family protein [Clostridia bacterium]
MMKAKAPIKEYVFDIFYTIIAGIIVGTAYHFFQNSNGFAPGGVGGLATITHYLLADKISWSILMIAFNLPIFILVSAMINKKLGLMLSVYMLVCIINKRQIGEMMKIIKSYPDTFASFEKVNEVFGNFQRKV